MKTQSKFLVALVALFSSFYVQNTHASVEKYATLSEIPSVLMEALPRKSYKEEFVYQVLRYIRQNAEDNKSLSQSDIVRLNEKHLKEARLRKVQEYMRYDANLDGEVSRQEIQDYFANSKRQTNQKYIDQSLKKLMAADYDQSGVVTRDEIVKSADQDKNKYSSRSNLTRLEKLIRLDPNSDGKLTINELNSLAEKAFNTIDLDNDGIISTEESQAVIAASRRASEINRLLKPNCKGFPTPDEDDKIIFIGLHRGNAVSSISVAGQSNETYVVPVQIDKGKEKLYIVASSLQPVIWDIKGDTKRISKMVLSGPSINQADGQDDKINSGVSNIGADLVSYHSSYDCGLQYAYAKDKKKQDMTLEIFTRLVGQLPDLLYNNYQATGIHVFGERVNDDISQKIEKEQLKAPKGFNQNLWNRHIDYVPGGLMKPKLTQILSDHPAEPYKVLPMWAGFSKLFHEGSITYDCASRSEVRSIDKNGRMKVECVEKVRKDKSKPRVNFGKTSSVRIIKNIPYYPSGLKGAYSTTIYITEGVEVPDGDPGHSKVINEKTNERIR